MTGAEIRERQEFCFEASLRMRDGYLAEEVWEALGLPVRECAAIIQRSAGRKFEELGVLEFEDHEDTSVSYERMDLDHAPWDIVQYQHY